VPPGLAALRPPSRARGPALGSGAWRTLGVPAEPGAAQLLHLVETPVATLRHAFYDQGATVPLHRHDRASLVYGVGGPCVETSASANVVRRRLTFLPAGYAHALEYRGPTHVLAIEIDPFWLRRGDSALASAASMALPGTLYDEIWRVLLDVATGEPPERVDASLAALLDSAASFADKVPSKAVMTLIDEMHTNWRAVPSLRELTVRHSLSPQYICRIFKRFTGVTLQQYALLLRLDYARGLLWGTTMPLAAVAAETGFADQSHLTRVLAAHSARTPLRLRWLAPCAPGLGPELRT
jgi:AraC-like DNA-binding protein/quercetin dioxygenase-like cupin family protein